MDKRVVATVEDDNGQDYEIVAWVLPGENEYEVIEDEAKYRGIRYATTIGVYYPDGLIEKEEGKDDEDSR